MYSNQLKQGGSMSFNFFNLFRNKDKKTFVSLLSDYLNKEMIENKLSKSTGYKYNQILNNVDRFLTYRDTPDLRPSEFKLIVADEFKTWLHHNLKSCSLTHAARNLEMCKRFLDYCERMEMIDKNPLKFLETKRDRTKEIIHIDENELDKFITYNFQAPVLRKTADLYLFQCATGLSYGDLYSYYYKQDEDGKEWLYNSRKKTDTPYYIPFLPLAKYILGKYNGELPKYSNGAYNRFLKEVAALLCIEKNLTTHTARKTFATLKYDKGYSIEVISKMLGHKSIKTTEKHYIGINKNRMLKEVKQFEISYK